MTPDEYEPCARRMAAHIGIEKADPTTFEVSRLMYWPSCCVDSEYYYKAKDAQFISADFLLSTYADWHNIDSWPQVPGTQNTYQKLAIKQGDPEAKTGMVGAWCRTYDVNSAIVKFLPGVYEPVDNQPDRYTYLGGSTTGGAVVYDNDKFLFSHHATDVCSGKLVNGFDLVRLHKFSDLDDDVDPTTPSNRLPSYIAMCKFAVADNNVAALLSQERYADAQKDFDGVTANNDDANPHGGEAANWMLKLQRNPQTGNPSDDINNIRIILENDPRLKDRFALNQFSGKVEVISPLPWLNSETCPRAWNDTDNNGLYWYMQDTYKIKKRQDIDAALDIYSAQHTFDEVQNYLKALEWDGVPRLDSLFIDYMGADNSEYVRAVTRKSFTAAVARAMMPGCKYDYMLILCGPQGARKSMLFDKMSGGRFNDSISTFEGKEAAELLRGVWIVEIAELQAFRRSDVARIKQFLTSRIDRYRPAYGRNMREYPRRCVFFGTCNESEFLTDTTGNRRFWPVDIIPTRATKDVTRELDAERDQLWAEAKARWQAGETLYLPDNLEKEAQTRQEDHQERNPNEGEIIQFVAQQVPVDWDKWQLDRRRDFWAGAAHGDIYLTDRNCISAKDIWCELFMKDKASCTTFEYSKINAVLQNIPGWHRGRYRSGVYGQIRGFIRE